MNDNRILPAESDIKMVYDMLLTQGWVKFSDAQNNRRHEFDPWELFPGAQPFSSEETYGDVEPLFCFVQDKCFGVFDAFGFAYYAFDSVFNTDLPDAGNTVFFPYENAERYR